MYVPKTSAAVREPAPRADCNREAAEGAPRAVPGAVVASTVPAKDTFVRTPLRGAGPPRMDERLSGADVASPVERVVVVTRDVVTEAAWARAAIAAAESTVPAPLAERGVADEPTAGARDEPWKLLVLVFVPAPPLLWKLLELAKASRAASGTAGGSLTAFFFLMTHDPLTKEAVAVVGATPAAGGCGGGAADDDLVLVVVVVVVVRDLPEEAFELAKAAIALRLSATSASK